MVERLLHLGQVRGQGCDGGVGTGPGSGRVGGGELVELAVVPDVSPGGVGRVRGEGRSHRGHEVCVVCGDAGHGLGDVVDKVRHADRDPLVRVYDVVRLEALSVVDGLEDGRLYAARYDLYAHADLALDRKAGRREGDAYDVSVYGPVRDRDGRPVRADDRADHGPRRCVWGFSVVELDAHDVAQIVRVKNDGPALPDFEVLLQVLDEMLYELSH